MNIELFKLEIKKKINLIDNSIQLQHLNVLLDAFLNNNIIVDNDIDDRWNDVVCAFIPYMLKIYYNV